MEVLSDNKHFSMLGSMLAGPAILASYHTAPYSWGGGGGLCIEPKSPCYLTLNAAYPHICISV